MWTQFCNNNGNETVLKIEERIIPSSLDDMSWTPTSWGTQMTLSRHVPEKIKAGVRAMVERLVHGTTFSLEGILKEAVFAVHPGGPKIIETVAENKNSAKPVVNLAFGPGLTIYGALFVIV